MANQEGNQDKINIDQNLFKTTLMKADLGLTINEINKLSRHYQNVAGRSLDLYRLRRDIGITNASSENSLKNLASKLQGYLE